MTALSKRPLAAENLALPLKSVINIIIIIIIITSPLSHFSPPLPLTKEVNKKLSYHGQNALSAQRDKNTRTQ